MRSHHRPASPDVIRMLVAAATSLLLLAVAPSPAVAAEDPPADGVVVQLQPGYSPEDLVAEHGVAAVDPLIPSRGWWVLRFPSGTDLHDAVDDIEDHEFPDEEKAVLLAEQWWDDAGVDGTRMSSWTEGEAVTSAAPRNAIRQQAAATLLDLDGAHAHGTATGVRVAVIDSGIGAATGLPVVGGWDFVDDDADPWEEADGLDGDGDGLVDEAFGHGTHVAGLVSMVAPDAGLLVYRVLDDEGHASVYAVAEAIEQAVADGADVINASFGTDDKADVLLDAVEAAHDADVVVVAAAGNTADDAEVFPAALGDVIAVGASTPEDTHAAFSSFGGWVEVYAPAVSLLSLLPDGSTAEWTGTSMAAPLTSGLAALLVGVAPDADPEDVETAIIETGLGILDAAGGEVSRMAPTQAMIRMSSW